MSVLTEPKEKLGVALARWEPMIAPMLPVGVSSERILQAALLVAMLDKTGALMKCTPKSIALGVARIAQWGLEPGVTAHLVPYGDTAQAVADYKGLVQLMREAGALDVDAQVVRDGDVFTYELGLVPSLRHVPSGKAGKIVAAYCIVRLPRGIVKFEVIDAESINALRQKYSKQWKSGELPEWYARKTVIRRAAKYVPMNSSKLARALEQDAHVGDAIPDAEIEPITGEVREIGVPMRRATVKMDHDAIGAEYGAEPQVKERTITDVSPLVAVDDPRFEGAYEPE